MTVPTSGAELALPVPHADAPPPGTELPPHYLGCFGCGTLEGGLRLRFTTGEQMTITSSFVTSAHHQGAPGIAHGGILAAVFDEALGALQVFFGERAVTASLQTEFRRPVRVGSLLHLQSRVDGRQGRKLRVSADARLGTPTGPIAAQASAVFVFVTEEHFVRALG